jgi:alkanesulfonate monooxygenase SsuD/methylene tetrahydromethanopterin reductase-like flavin-dependent oxidoreductase (luciferase family)
MELILKAWTEPHPFSWEGRHFQYRTVSVWPRPLQQPYPPTYALGTSRESCEFAAREHLGLGMSFGPFEVVSKATRYYREQCALQGWEPSPEQSIYRANILLAESDAEAQEALQRRQQCAEVPFPMRPGVRDALMKLDSRNLAGDSQTSLPEWCPAADVRWQSGHDCEAGRALPREVGAGVIDLFFQSAAVDDPQRVMQALELFGKAVLPRIREI